MSNTIPKKEQKPNEVKGILLLLVRIVAVFVFLTIIYILSLRLPIVQNWTKNLVLNYINSAYKQDIQINKFYFDPIDGFAAEIFIPDHHQDTLFYTDNVQIGLLKSLVTLYQNSIEIKDLKFNKLTSKIIHYPGEKENNLSHFTSRFSSTGTSDPINFNIKSISLNSSRVLYKTNSYDAIIHLDKFKAVFDSINTQLDFYKIRKILVDNPRIDLVKLNTDINSLTELMPDTQNQDTCKENYILALDFLNINNGSLNMIYEKDKSYKYYDFNKIFLSAFQLFISRDLAQFDFLHVNAKTKDEFVLKNAVFNQFKLNKHILFFNNIKIETGRSKIETKFQVDATNPFQGNFQGAFLRLNVLKSLIDPKDVSYFLPKWNLYNFIRTKTDLPFYLQGEIFGKAENLKGKNISFVFENNLSFKGNIQTRNLFVKSKALINLKVDILSTKASFIRKLLPDFNIPETYNKFGNIRFTGNYDGYFHDFVAYGTFRTDLGIFHSDIKFKLPTNQNIALYSGSFEAIDLKLGSLLEDKNLGKINMKSNIINGRGLSRNNFFVNIESSISSLEYRNYIYKDIRFKGTLKKDQFTGEIKIQDENIDLSINGIVEKNIDAYKVNIHSRVNKINFHALNLTNDTIIYSGIFNSNFEGSDESNISGHLSTFKTTLIINNKNITLTNFKIEQSVSKSSRKLILNSDFVAAELDGVFRLDDLKDNIFDYLNKKYPELATSLNLKVEEQTKESSVKGFIYVKDGPLLSAILNIPLIFDKADCDFNFNSQKELLEINSNRFDILYKDIVISKMSFSLISSDNLKFIFSSDYFSKDDKKLAGNFKFSSNYDGQSGQSSLQIFDSTDTKIASNILTKYYYNSDTFKVSILNKDLFINKSRWKINENNNIQITKGTFSIQNFELTDNDRYLSLQDNHANGLVINTDGFDISFVNQFIKNKSIAFYGLFASEINIPDLKSFVNSTAKITIFQMHFNQDNFGPFNINVLVDDYNEPWNIAVENIFQEHIIRGTGTINIPIKPKSYQYKPFDFHIDLQLTSFPMSFLDNFISGINNTTGSASGKLKFYSRDHDLILEGNALVKEGRFFIDYLSAPLFIKDQTLVFQENLIVLKKINLLDSLGNLMYLDGNLAHTYFKEFSANLRLIAPKALLLNTKKGENQSYYGLGIGSVDAKFSGLISKMDMDVSLNMQKGTKINIPVVTGNSANDLQFIRFTDKNQNNVIITKKETNNEGISGLNINAQITFTEDAEIAIIFDEQAGDILRGFGRGNLIIKSLRNGLFTVNGSYEIEEGQYLFTLYNFVNKPFTLRRGGLITWTGDPINADINLEAVYEGLNTSILPLITEYVTSDERNELRQQRTDVKVRMLLTGQLLQPNIKFDIDLPELTGNIKNFADTKLRYLRSNEDQLNQQIFGLLVLGSFINSNNTGSVIGNIQATGINTISEMLFNQASLFVSNILSNAFDDVDFISGIDFNIGYDLNKENLGATGINEGEVVLSVKPRFWNDQLIVTLGGNYRSNSNASLYGNSNFNPESVIEWNTPVKGLKLRVYYKGNESIEGIKHKIGTGINYRKEFDSFLDFEGELRQLVKEIKSKQDAN